MIKSIVIAEKQRGLLVRDGRLERVLGPRRHYFWAFSRAKVFIEDALGLCSSDLVDGIEMRHPALAEAHFEIVTPAIGEVAIVRLDGRARYIVKGGAKAYFWKVLETVSVETIDTEDAPKLTKRQLAELEGTTAVPRAMATPIATVPVEQGRQALVFFDGELIESVGPGRHAYWQVGRKVTAKTVDTRAVPLEVTAQEILTKDKVSVRLTLTSFVQVTDPQVAATAVPDYEAHVYKLVQFAVREAVGGRTLDELLKDRAAVDKQIASQVRKELGDIGVRVTELGVKDVILPGDMRELINKVVEAEKVAQANLIRRREETAATRSLLNTAKLMDDNPTLMRLKELEALEKVTEKIGSIEVVSGSNEGLNVLVDRLVQLKPRG